MPFRYYTNLLSQASRTVAASVMVVGMLLIGFAMLIMALPALFAFLAAAVFFLAGGACMIAGIKMFCAQRQLDKHLSDDEDAYRENVVIHHHDDGC